jgi:hypothetical protein
MAMVRACAERDVPEVVRRSAALGFLTGELARPRPPARQARRPVGPAASLQQAGRAPQCTAAARGAAACRHRPDITCLRHRCSLLAGDESRVMLDAHVEAGQLVGVPFGTPGLYDFGSHGGLTRRVTDLGATMLKHRLTPPPDESYSLHRKLSGAFLACIKLRARVPCQQLFYGECSRHARRAAEA